MVKAKKNSLKKERILIMKKLLLFLLSLTLTVGGMAACGKKPSKPTSESSSESVSIPEDKYYTVTFEQEGMNDIVKTVKEGEVLTDIPAVNQKTGYTTVWSVTDFSNITANMTVTAVSTANEYTITYDAGEGNVEMETQKVTFDAVPGTFAVPTRENYEFVCWTYDNNAILPTSPWKIAGDVTLVAKWQENQKYTVTFAQAGCDPLEYEVYEGGTLSMDSVEQPQPITGYTVEWDLTGVDLTNITESITVQAKATPNQYTVTYDAGEGTVTPVTQTVTYDAVPGTFAEPTLENYTFMYWMYEENAVSPTEAWKIASNVMLVAKWQENDKFAIEFIQSGCTTLKFEVYEGESFSMSGVADPQPVEGYTVEWDLTGVDFTNITKPISVYVKATPNDYTITYDAKGGTVTPATQTVTYNAVPGTFAEPTRENYKFICWQYEGKPIYATDAWKIAKNVTLTAKWEENKKYTVTFVQTNCEPLTFDVYEGKALSLDTVGQPQPRKGYTVEWDLTGIDLTNITSSFTVKAKETANSYTVTYEGNGGTASKATQTVTFDIAPGEFATATRYGYTFKGWTYNGQLVSPDSVWALDKDVTLVAKWEVKTYTVTFNANGGKFSDGSTEVTYTWTYGGENTVPTLMTKADATFEGWLYNNSKFDLSKIWGLEGEKIEFKAEWKEEGWTNNY